MSKLLEAAKAVVKSADIIHENGKLTDDEIYLAAKEYHDSLDALRAAIEQGEWISVEDAKPKPWETVLLHGELLASTGYWTGESWGVHVFNNHSGEPTHWQPLPAPPEVKP